jgi:hypothetical protein
VPAIHLCFVDRRLSSLMTAKFRCKSVGAMVTWKGPRLPGFGRGFGDGVVGGGGGF